METVTIESVVFGYHMYMIWMYGAYNARDSCSCEETRLQANMAYILCNEGTWLAI